MTTLEPLRSPGLRSRKEGRVTSPGAAPGFISAKLARGVVRIAACVMGRAACCVDVSGRPGATGGACVTAVALFAGAGEVTAVLSAPGGGALLDEKSRGVRTMTSAIKAAARSVR